MLWILLGASLMGNAYALAQNQWFPSVYEQAKLKYPYLSLRILAEDYNDVLINFLPLREQLRHLTAAYEKTFAYYFEYLPTGSSLALNEYIEFSAASLIKLPVVMAYYHQKERLKQTEDPTVTIKSDNLDSLYGELWKKGVGSQINLAEVVRLSLVESDNTAVLVLASHVDKQDFNAVYEGLDIDFKQVSGETIITAKQYAMILKALYFASVLTKDSSQRILDLLTQTKFNDKLPSGVPSEVTVAHKTGILGDEMFQDCGIVYLPKRPYLLCMVSKADEATTRSRMQTLSRAIYNYVAGVNRKAQN